MPQGYPSTAESVLDPPVRFNSGTIYVMRWYQRMHPWRGSVEERMDKMRALVDGLNGVYGKTTSLEFRDINGSFSGSSSYVRSSNLIILRGRLSLITLLHEYAHSLGKDEFGAVRWSTNLVRKIFPKSFARLKPFSGHCLISARQQMSGDEGGVYATSSALRNGRTQVRQHERRVE